MSRRRARTLLVLALVASLATAGAAGAQTDESPEPAPPAPERPAPAAPAPFPLPMDAGTRFVAQRQQARADLARLAPEVGQAAAVRDELALRWEGLNGHLAQLDVAARDARRELDESRLRLRASAADAYKRSSGDRSGALQAVTDADEPLDVRRDLHLIATYGARELRRYEELRAVLDDVEQKVAHATDQRAQVRNRLDEASRYADSARAAVEDARRRLAEAEEGLVQFHAVARTASSPILGPNLLTAAELAAFVRASGNVPRLTVSLDELAQLYIEESAAVGVRGDVAWAQSILETGWFGFHGSMVKPEDNNFAGVGACDSCTRGFQFPDARTGVRAQVQLLRVYTDRSVQRDSLPHPLVLPGTLRLGFRGRVQSWWDLTGTWATANDYGIRVYQLYDRMVVASGRR